MVNDFRLQLEVVLDEEKRFRRNTSIWVLTSFVFLTSFRFMSSFAFLNFFVGLTSLDFELFWCLMLFVLFCCLTSLVLCTLSKKMCAIIDLFLSELFRPFLLLLSSSFCLYVLCFHGIIRYCYDNIFGLLF